MTAKVALPKYDDLFSATLKGLKVLGGSGSVEEINDGLITLLGATQAQLDVTYKSGVPVLTHRMAWARSFLKLPGLVTNPTRGVWVLTEDGRAAVDKPNTEIKQIVSAAQKALLAAKKAAGAVEEEENEQEPAAEGIVVWSDRLLQRVQFIDPAAFERLCQRLLRESGFTRVEVTGKSGDGGIDGAGVLRMNLISFRVLFQCKRWKGAVGSDVVRNFRGAIKAQRKRGLSSQPVLSRRKRVRKLLVMALWQLI